MLLLLSQFSMCWSWWQLTGNAGRGSCSEEDLTIRQEEVHWHVVGTTLPERLRCGHASIWWKPRLYQELEGPTGGSHWGQAAVGPRCGMRTTKCQLLATSLCVMVSRWVWGDLCRTGVNCCLSHTCSERASFSHVLFFAGGGQAKPTAWVIVAPWVVIAGRQHCPPSTDRLLVSQGCHCSSFTTRQLSRSRKERLLLAEWVVFRKKKCYLLVSWEQKREDGAAAVTLVAGRVVNCRWDQWGYGVCMLMEVYSWDLWIHTAKWKWF